MPRSLAAAWKVGAVPVGSSAATGSSATVGGAFSTLKLAVAVPVWPRSSVTISVVA